MTIPAGSIPSRIYHYPDRVATSDPYEYTIDVSLENKGASDTYGGVYISGFDPHLIEFKAWYLTKWMTGGSTVMLISQLSSPGFVSGGISCDIRGIGDIFYGQDAGGWRAGGTNLNIGEMLGELLGTDYFDENPIYGDIVYDSNQVMFSSVLMLISAASMLAIMTTACSP